MGEPTSTPAEPPLALLPREHPAQVFGALPVRELVTLVQGANDKPHASETQFVLTAFYHRYGPYLVAVAARALGPLCDRGDLEEIVHDTILQFFQKSAEFSVERAAGEAAGERNLRAYLGQRAMWKARDVMRARRRLGVALVDDAALEHEANRAALAGAPETARADAPVAADDRTRRIADWLGTLDEMECEVLRLYYLDDHLGQKSDRLPAGVAANIASKYGVTTSALRHVKLKLIRQFREKFGDTENSPDAQR